MRRISILVFAIFPLVAQADLIEVQIGDADGLGFGVLPDASFNYLSIGPADGDGTDEWFFGNQSFNMLYDISGIGTIESAFLEVFTGGQGYLGISTLYIDNLLVGQLTDGDIGLIDNNIARLDIFDLTSFSSSLDGNTAFSIHTNINDGWALDYMKLTITTVPEPGTLALFGIGLAGMGLARRRKQLA